MFFTWLTVTVVTSFLVLALLDQHRACRARSIRVSKQLNATQLRIELAGGRA
ncbi:hypothetical protein Dxin01_00200 [Deinococcus xinjiangensis]|uniref:Uncharacterized protein n=1 Tax=Deinococcus xinjiangensis TaxID=457454 RepID=A0ABP9V5B9_9DEIO